MISQKVWTKNSLHSLSCLLLVRHSTAYLIHCFSLNLVNMVFRQMLSYGLNPNLLIATRPFLVRITLSLTELKLLAEFHSVLSLDHFYSWYSEMTFKTKLKPILESYTQMTYKSTYRAHLKTFFRCHSNYWIIQLRFSTGPRKIFLR